MTIRVSLALGALLMALAALAAPAAAQSGVQTLKFKYGPVKIAPGQNTIEIDENQAQAARRRLDHRLPAEPRRYKNGSVPRVDVIHLHHGVWLKNLQPLFAAGEEKTEFAAPPGYGWRYRTTDQWHMNHMIHNLTPTPDAGLHHLRARLHPRHVAAGGEHEGDPDGLDRRRRRHALPGVRRQARPARLRPAAHLPGRGPRARRGNTWTVPDGRRARRHRAGTCIRAGCGRT